MDNPINAVKSALNVRFLIMALVAFWLIGLVAGFLGLSNWIINPYGALINQFPSLGKFRLNSQ